MNQSRNGTLSELSFLDAPPQVLAGVNHIAFSDDGAQMAISRTDMTIDLFVGGEFSRSFELSSADEKVKPTQRIRGLAFGRQGDRLLVASADRLQCIALEFMAPSWKIVPPRSFGFLVSSPLALAVGKDGSVAATFDNGSLGIWSPEGRVRFLRRESNSPRNIQFASNDDLVIGTDGFSVCSWDSRWGKPKLKKLLGERAYSSTCWSAGSLVAVRSLSSVSVFSVDDGALQWRRSVDVGLPLLAFDGVTGQLAITEEHGLIIVDAEGTELQRHTVLGGAVTSVAFHPVTGQVAIGKADGEYELLGA